MSDELINETHDPARRSWVDSANIDGTPFPIQNLPFGIFCERDDAARRARVGIAIGDAVLDLDAVCSDGLLGGDHWNGADDTLNALMAGGNERASALRLAVSRLLAADTTEGTDAQRVRDRILVPSAAVEMSMPAAVRSFTDFYASIFHAQNVGRMFRPDNPLLPNYKYIPIAYHGRASSIVVSGTPFHRPIGQRRPKDAPPGEPPVFEASRSLDYEAELGILVGAPNAMGDRVDIDRAGEHVFGLCLLNDWSARDIQAWEYQPLGPFLGKSFASTISPWVVTLEALAPFRCPSFRRPDEDPPPLDYLSSERDAELGGIDISIEIRLETETMRTAGTPPERIGRTSFRDMYWTIFQMLTHHTSNGCNLESGDLLGTGTISGAGAQELGSLLERTRGGKEPLTLASGESRSFLADGDEVILDAFCERDGYRRIGFGECRGRVLPAKSATSS